MKTSPAGPGPARVTLVTAPACHFCADAREALAVLAGQYPLTVTETDAAGPPGQALLRAHGSGMFPLVLVDGEFFSAGRLPRRKLARLLAARGAAAAAEAATAEAGARTGAWYPCTGC